MNKSRIKRNFKVILLPIEKIFWKWFLNALECETSLKMQFYMTFKRCSQWEIWIMQIHRSMTSDQRRGIRSAKTIGEVEKEPLHVWFVASFLITTTKSACKNKVRFVRTYSKRLKIRPPPKYSSIHSSIYVLCGQIFKPPQVGRKQFCWSPPLLQADTNSESHQLSCILDEADGYHIANFVQQLNKLLPHFLFFFLPSLDRLLRMVKHNSVHFCRLFLSLTVEILI